jgi:hypothetical protein
MFTRTLSVTALFVTTFLGCAKDMNADDYKEIQRKRDVGKLLPATGTYTGTLKSRKTGVNLGAVKIKIEVDTKSQGDSSDPGRAAGKVVLKAGLEFKGALSATASAADAFFDPTIGHFNTSISIKRQAAVSGLPVPAEAAIDIDGVISPDGAFSGLIYGKEGNVEYKEDGASFHLQRSGPSLEEINKASAPDQSLFFTQANFAGSSTFVMTRDEAGKFVVKPVNLVLLKPSRSTPEQDFVELLLPTKPLLATLNFSDSMRLQFSNAVLDRRTGLLGGDAVIQHTSSSGSKYEGTLSLNCRIKTDSGGYDCGLRTNSSTAEVAKISVQPSEGQTEPSVPLRSKPKAYVYYGRGQFPKQVGEKVVMTWSRIKFFATYRGKTLEEEILDMVLPTHEKLIQVSFGFRDTPLAGGNPSWNAVRFDDANDGLSGEGPGPVTQSTMMLQCQRFTFDNPKLGYDFECMYTNSVIGTACPLELKGH